MGTPDPLRSSYLKLGRANDHIESLNEAVDGFLDTDPYMVKTDFYEKIQEFVLRLQIRESSPERISLIVGDVVNNLRAALDQMICDLVRSRGADCNQTQFPMHRVTYPNAPPKSMSVLAGPIWTHLERTQPSFISPDDPEIVLLYQMVKLSNRDKHRSILLAATTTEEFTVTAPFGMDILDPVYRGPFAHDAVFARIKPHGPLMPNVYVEFDVSPTVGFGKGSGPATGAPVVKMLEGCAEVVTNIIEDFAQYF